MVLPLYSYYYSTIDVAIFEPSLLLWSYFAQLIKMKSFSVLFFHYSNKVDFSFYSRSFFIAFQNSVTKYFRTHYSKGEKLTWRNWRYLKVALVDQNVSFNIKKLVWILYLYLQDDATFTITVDGKTFHFQAQDSEERERWIRALEETVLRLVAWFPPFFDV